MCPYNKWKNKKIKISELITKNKELKENTKQFLGSTTILSKT